MVKYKIGDRVRIIPLSDVMPNWNPEMNQYAGTVMTIRKLRYEDYDESDYPFRMIEDDGCWNWGTKHIVGLEDEIEPCNIDFDNFNSLL